jgi:hypothetical protein
MKFFALVVAAIPAISALALPASLEARQETIQYRTIHPNGDKSKCVGVLGGKFTIGSYVDIYDCNGSVTQKWGLGGGADGYFVANPANGDHLCMDLENYDTPDNGTKILLRRCAGPNSEDGIWHQSFDPSTAGNAYTIRSVARPASGDFDRRLCLDLTDGSKTNGNVLQLWTCNPDKTKPYKNQIWTTINV